MARGQLEARARRGGVRGELLKMGQAMGILKTI